LELGTDQHGFGFGATAKKSNNRQFVDYGTPYGKGDIIGCFIDLLDKFTISFSKNGTDLGVAFEMPNRLR
jgi:ATP-dependent RNA helicase DDX1